MLVPEAAAPRVSVLLPIYGGEKYLRATMDAVLGQTFRDFELIVVDDSSPDASRQIVLTYNDPRIRLIQNPRNVGQTASMQIALEHARGQYCARQDQDDVSLPTRFERQVAVLDARPEIGVLGTECAVIDENGRLLPELFVMHREETLAEMAWRMVWTARLADSSVMFRTDAARRVGGFDLRFRYAQDYDLWVRLSCGVGVARLSEALLQLRVHRESASNRFETVQTAEVEAIIEGAVSRLLGRPIRRDQAAAINRSLAEDSASRRDVLTAAALMDEALPIFAAMRPLRAAELVPVRQALAESLIKLAIRHRRILGASAVGLLLRALRACPRLLVSPTVLYSWWQLRKQGQQYREAVSALWGKS